MSENGHTSRIAVIGVGNLLYADDGFGVRVVEALRAAPPAGADLIDGSTLGVGLIEYLKDYATVIIVDAADMGLAPGTLRVFQPDDVRNTKTGSPLSLHSADILGVIALGRALGETLADVYVVAVQPEMLGIREGLSDSVAASVAGAAEMVRGTISRLRSWRNA